MFHYRLQCDLWPSDLGSKVVLKRIICGDELPQKSEGYNTCFATTSQSHSFRCLAPVFTLASKSTSPSPWREESSGGSCSCSIRTPPMISVWEVCGASHGGRGACGLRCTAVARGDIHPIWPGNRRVHSRKEAVGALPRKLQMTADKILIRPRKLSGWMDGPMDWCSEWWIDGWVDQWTDWWMDGWMDELFGGQMNQMDKFVDGWTEGLIGGWMDRWTDRRIDWWMDGQMDGRKDWLVDGWMESWNGMNLGGQATKINHKSTQEIVRDCSFFLFFCFFTSQEMTELGKRGYLNKAHSFKM